VGVERLFDVIDAADERSDIDNQRLVPALFQDSADVEQRSRLLAGIDRPEMTDHQPSLLARGGEAPPQFGIDDPGGGFHVRRQRGQHAFAHCPAHQGIGGEFASHQGREHHDGIGEQQRRQIGDTAQPVQAGPFMLHQDDTPPTQAGDGQRQQRPDDHALPGHEGKVADHAARRSDRAPDIGNRSFRPRQG